MSRKESPAAGNSMFGALVWPIVMGLLGSAGFYALVLWGPLEHPVMLRYFTGHPICIVETVFFFVCLAALLQKLTSVWAEQSALGSVSLGDNEIGQPASRASELLDTLGELPARARSSYLGRRLEDALAFVHRRGGSDGLEAELKSLSDGDIIRQQDSYALIRIIVWATPMLGFLGTVIGITKVIGDLAKQDMVNVQGAMQGLLSGLYVKFDTTALALGFTVVLMFIQFLVDRLEIQILETVDRRANDELLGRFSGGAIAAADPNVRHIQQMAQTVIKASEQLVERQAELWQSTVGAAHQHWQRLASSNTEQVQTALTAALSQSLGQHANQLAKIEQASSEQLAQRWEQWQTALSQNARLLSAQQQELIRQGEVMTQAIRAAGEVISLEKALNQNLNALAGSKNFEDTVMSLAAAIHLLNTKLGAADASHVELRGSDPKVPHARGRAA